MFHFVICTLVATMYAVWTTSSQEVHLVPLFNKYKFPCDQEVVLFRCTSKGEVQYLTLLLTTSERNLEQQSIMFDRGNGESVTPHEGVVHVSGSVMAVLQHFSTVNANEHIFEYQSDIILNCTSMAKAVINCSSDNNNYDIKELIPSSIPNNPQLSYTVVASDSSGQVVNIKWQEPDNADLYDLDYYHITIQPDDTVYRTKDTKISEYLIEGKYSVNVVVVNQCGQYSDGSLEHITVSATTEGQSVVTTVVLWLLCILIVIVGVVLLIIACILLQAIRVMRIFGEVLRNEGRHG